jgi:hypothetical protein
MGFPLKITDDAGLLRAKTVGKGKKREKRTAARTTFFCVEKALAALAYSGARFLQ